MGGKLKRDGELGNGGGGNRVWSEYIVNGSLCEATSERKKLVLEVGSPIFGIGE